MRVSEASVGEVLSPLTALGPEARTHAGAPLPLWHGEGTLPSPGFVRQGGQPLFIARPRGLLPMAAGSSQEARWPW